MSNTDLYNRIREDYREFASLPHTLVEVLRVASDPDVSTKELAAVLMKDPGMTTRVLRLVNSPFYGAGREITTVTQAVTLLGIRSVTALALSSSVYQVTSDWSSSLDRVRFWRHSIEVAIASRKVAEAINYACPEEAFVAGLLHNIGLLALESSFPEAFVHIWQKVESPHQLYDLEQEELGTDHIRVGQFILEQWKLPSDLTDAVGGYRACQLGEEDRSPCLLPQIVALADTISKFSVLPTSTFRVPDLAVRRRLIDHLHLSDKKVSEIEKELFTQTASEAAFLEIDIGSPTDLLAEANGLLYTQFIEVERLLRENRRMQHELAQHEMEKVAIDNLKTIVATFGHYINNATATILGRAQLIEAGVNSGAVADSSGSIALAMQVIVNSVNTISAFMDELSDLSRFETTVYHDDTSILDIEERIRERLAESTKALHDLDKNAVAP
jgi:HD-like signal output (HDOD) protein